MTNYDPDTVEKAITQFIMLEWQNMLEQPNKVEMMVEEWDDNGGLIEILYDKGYTDDEGVSMAENMDYDQMVEYYFDYHWFPKRQRELTEIWDSGVTNDD